MPGLLLSIPSPSSGVLEFGPLTVRAYGLCIALGVIVAVGMASRRWVAQGGRPDDMAAIATWGVPSGIVGARLYHVITDWKTFRGNWGEAPMIWKGGLGIWGGVAGGVLAGLVVAKRRRMAFGPLLDAVAPAIPLAQAIGRWGNWFNQELFGRPTTLPWGLEISERKRPPAYSEFATFHPTFLYECLWNLVIVGAVLAIGRRRSGLLRPGHLFALYVAMYTFGRFWIERLRIDHASQVGGLRVNQIVSVAVFVAAAAVLLSYRRKSGPVTDGTVGRTEDRAEGP